MIKTINDQGRSLPGASKNQKPAVDPELKEACLQFEGLLVKKMLEATASSTEMFGKGFGGSFFQGMFYEEIAQKVAGGQSGLAESLYNQMARPKIK